jgi:hypothetical protein
VDAPAEDGAPQEVEHGTVLGDLRGCDQSIEDDPGLTPVHDVVDLVAEPALPDLAQVIGVASGSVFDARESEVRGR